MTLDEFLAWTPDEETGSRWQLVDGEPVMKPPSAERHALVAAELSALMQGHLLAIGRSCAVMMAPGVVPRVRANESYRVPDLGVTCSPPSDALMTPAPVLLVEILSPSNEKVTRGNIWTYTTVPSVQEILVLRSTRVEAELLRRQPDGSWPAEAEVIKPPGLLRLESIGFACPLADAYRTAGLVG